MRRDAITINDDAGHAAGIASHYDCLVVGAGPAGLAAALALRSVGVGVAIAGTEPPAAADADTRTAALLPSSRTLLEQLNCWAGIVGSSAELKAIRIADATGSLLRAPEVLFSAAECGWTRLATNVPNATLTSALTQAATDRGVTLLTGGPVLDLTCGEPVSTLRLASGATITARLVVAADGRNSLCREAAGLGVRRWSYDQTAIATRFTHSRPHAGISTELHRRAGPCTTVPLPGLASSLVWVERPAEAARLMALAPEQFLAELGSHLGGLLGTLAQLGVRSAFPLSGLAAERLGKSRVALVGEAAHVLPPIGAQGLNLGLLDAATLADCVGTAVAEGADIGGDNVLDTYSARRLADMTRRIEAVDLLNRSLTSGWLPVSLARGAGLHVLAASPSLRGRIMREGLIPAGTLPALMRDEEQRIGF